MPLKILKCWNTDCDKHKLCGCYQPHTNTIRTKFDLPAKSVNQKLTLLHEIGHKHLGHTPSNYDKITIQKELECWSWVKGRRSDLFKKGFGFIRKIVCNNIEFYDKDIKEDIISWVKQNSHS